MSPTDLDGRHVFIVGGSSGIGLTIARRCAAAGAHVAIFARRPDVLAQAAAEIAAHRPRADQTVSSWPLDAADADRVARVMHDAVAATGVPTLLINCVGRAHPRRFEHISAAELTDTLRVNLGSCWHATQFLFPLMKARGGGYIVNVASLAGIIGVFGYTDYCASKFAVVGFSEALRSELKPHGISVSVLCPPDTDTPGLMRENDGKPEETRAISANASVLSADAVADALFRGMARGQFLIVPGRESKVAVLAKRLVPGLVSWVMDRIIWQVQRRT
jgi:short-subunit dehydrogenase